MNRTPTQSEPRIAAPHTPPVPQKPMNDRGDLILLIAAVLTLAIAFTVLFSLMVRQSGASSGGDTSSSPDESTSEPEDTHIAVTYPTAPTRTSYLLSGSGTTIDSTKIAAGYAILVSLDDYSVLASQNADEKMYPASMTKIMTLIVACEKIKDASVILTIDNELYNYCASQGATTLVSVNEQYPTANDSFTASDLMYAVGVISAADACLALANHIAGSEEAFVALMNDKCAELGLTATHFSNCTGLDDDGNYSTVREMATILAYALDNAFCKEILSTDNRDITATYNMGTETAFPYTCHLYNTIWNRLADAGYEKKIPAKLSSGKTLLGGKTGYTTIGKFCLASFAKDAEGKLYIIVTAAGATVGSSVTDMNTIYASYS